MAEGANPYHPIDEEIIANWLAHLDASEHTKDLYRLGFRTFCEFVRATGADFDSLEQLVVIDFKYYLKLERALSPSTVNAYLAGVRSFYSYAEQHSDLKNIARGVKGVKKDRGFRRNSLTSEQVHAVLKAIDRSDEAGLRDYAMINLMAHLGLRDIEVSRANVGDITQKHGVDVLMVHGKGRASKDDYMVLTPSPIKHVRLYLAERGELKASDPLFASVANRNPGARLTTRSVSRIVKAALERAGIFGKEYTAHSLRHTTVTLALQGGATDREAQQMARHADVSTTALYSHDLDRLRNAAEWRVAKMLGDE
ncbi:MAG: tyrosine-type recombinase/integrase [Muribaculaceae bacterium]|nr:tyrosine-type recombinase/integrase [Muribaculaceae bacterium]